MGGRGCAVWSGVKGGKWDKCNSIINIPKVKDKERLLKAAKEKQLVTYRDIPVRLSK